MVFVYKFVEMLEFGVLQRLKTAGDDMDITMREEDTEKCSC